MVSALVIWVATSSTAGEGLRFVDRVFIVPGRDDPDDLFGGFFDIALIAN